MHALTVRLGTALEFISTKYRYEVCSYCLDMGINRETGCSIEEHIYIERERERERERGRTYTMSQSGLPQNMKHKLGKFCCN